MGVLEMSPFRVFIGWDQREPEAYEVAKYSLVRRASVPVEVVPIKLDELRARGLYARDVDPLASTEFTYSRFLTPTLAGFNGWALFCDCDFLWLGDVGELLEHTQSAKAVYCVQHDQVLICIACNGLPMQTSARFRSIGIGSKAGTRSRHSERRKPFILRVVGHGFHNGRTSITAIFGELNATKCCDDE